MNTERRAIARSLFILIRTACSLLPLMDLYYRHHCLQRAVACSHQSVLGVVHASRTSFVVVAYIGLRVAYMRNWFLFRIAATPAIRHLMTDIRRVKRCISDAVTFHTSVFQQNEPPRRFARCRPDADDIRRRSRLHACVFMFFNA